MPLLSSPQPVSLRAPLRLKRGQAFGLSLAACLSLSILLASGRAFAVALPALALVSLCAGFVVVLWRRDGQLPAFEVGSVVVITTTLYAAVPLLNFWGGGLRWSILSDNRLYNYQTTPDELGAFAWRHVVYLACFAGVYLLARGRALAGTGGPTLPGRATTLAILGILAAIAAYFAVVETLYGVAFNPSYAALRAGLVRSATELPHTLQQIASYGQGVMLVLKLCGLVLLLRRWRVPFWRGVLIVWLCLEAFVTTLRLGARTETALLLFGSLLLYHRLVRPFTLRTAVLAGGAFLAAITLYGFAREFGGEPLSLTALLSANNEFQSVFGTAFDLYRRQAAGALLVPWQLSIHELYFLLPSRLTALLPFFPWDPSEWYLEVIGQRGTGVGFMFSVISQAIIGQGWVELALRGSVLGGLLALVHRGYARRASSFWATVFYCYLCIWAYYTFRSTTFHFVYFLIYRFLPTFIVVVLCAALLRGAGQRRR